MEKNTQPNESKESRSKTETYTDDKARFKEIIAILNKNDVIKGITPEKLRVIIEELGPTFIKLGQVLSMRTDFLPKSYCEELAKLQSDVPPMPFSEVRIVVEEACGGKLEDHFKSFAETPLGSASIAQAHLATLSDGSRVVVKVQRIGIHETMSRDIDLLRKAAKILKIASGSGEVIDFGMVLDELWAVAQEEMNFLIEAKNAEEFYELQKNVAFATCPIIYRDITTEKMLVMEYIDGFAIDDKESLTANGYDMSEIGTKLADNYIKQITEDGFFHADPHPGNIKVRDGKIVWIDFGMMGRLSNRDQKLLSRGIEAVSKSDIGAIEDVIIAMGECHGKIDHIKLYSDIEDLFAKYSTMDLGGMDLSEVMEDALNAAKAHQISMPAGISMLARGCATIEGLLAEISPETNMLEITAARASETIFTKTDFKKEISDIAKASLGSSRKALDVPGLAADLLRMINKGQSKVNIQMNASDDFEKAANRIADKLIGGILVAALLVGSSLICTTAMQPRLLGIPALGVVGYLAAVILAVWLYVNARNDK